MTNVRVKRIARVVVVTFMLLLPSLVIAGGPTQCSINPNPVPDGMEFTISAVLQPNKAYDIRIDQDDHFGHHDDSIAIFADANGNWSYTYNLWNDPRDGLTLGAFNVHIKPSSEVSRTDKGSGGAACSGTVV